MSYSNSGLTVHTKLSPNNSGTRTHSIDRISPHCVVGQCSIESLGNWFAQKSAQASSNYGIDKDGRIGLFVPESCRSWCTSSNANDQRAVTIECASDTFAPYRMNDIVYKQLVALCTDICKRNGKKKLIWFGDRDKSLNYMPAADEMILTVHRWFAAKSCPGDWLYSRLGDLALKVTSALAGSGKESGTQAVVFSGLSEQGVIDKVGPLFTADQKKTGVLASVSMAQFLLESAYGKSELAQKANNCFGMKKSLSGNTWSGSAWDGSSVYTKQTKEQNANGSYVTITADFRKYSCVEDSIADHSAYLLGARNGNKLRYDGLKGCTNYKKAVEIIRDGGYATSLAYGINLCALIEKWGLTKYDYNAVPSIDYRAHVQDQKPDGWMDPVSNGKWAGTRGKSKRLEALKITPPEGVELEVTVHIQDIGDKVYTGIKKGVSSGKGSSKNDPIIGTTGQGRRLEGISIRCTKNTTGYKIYYQGHCQDTGDTQICSEGEFCGSRGKSRRLEAFRMWFAK